MPRETLNGRLRNLADEIVDRGLTLSQARREFEKQLVIAALRHNDCSIGRSADALGIHRNTLRNKVGSLDIELDRVRAHGDDG